MRKDVNVTISPWGGMLFPMEELRATLTYLSYKVGVPVYVDYDFPSEKEMEAYAQEVQDKVKPAARNLEAFLGGLTPISLEEVGGDHGAYTYPGGEEEAFGCHPRPYVEYFGEDWFAW
jgi:hypothetical protein